MANDPKKAITEYSDCLLRNCNLTLAVSTLIPERKLTLKVMPLRVIPGAQQGQRGAKKNSTTRGTH